MRGSSSVRSRATPGRARDPDELPPAKREPGGASRARRRSSATVMSLFTRPAARAVRAGAREDPLEVAAGALARDLDQAELGDRAGSASARGRGPAPPRSARTPRCRWSGSSMSMKSTTSSPPRSRRRICRATSGAASRLAAKTVSSRSSFPTNLPGVDVDRDEGLGLVDHDRAPGGQRNPAPQRVLDLGLDSEAREEGLGLARTARAGDASAGETTSRSSAHPLEGRGVVDADGVEVVVHEVARGAQGEVGLAVEERRRRPRSRAAARCARRAPSGRHGRPRAPRPTCRAPPCAR